uniref:PDZ domain-containing protein n=2 Tax=Schistocephalus solidus TaxID=70667 RepID=A0A0X3PBA1_SCHSO
MSNIKRKNSNTPNIADTRTKKTGVLSAEENLSISSPIKATPTRPRDFRPSSKDECTSFSRASTARRSLGSTNQTWLDAADELDTQYTTSRPQSFVYNLESSTHQTSYISGSNKNPKAKSKPPRDPKYDRDTLNLAKLIPVNGPCDLNSCGFALRPVFDESVNRWWAAKIKKRNGPNSANSSRIALREGDFIVKVNGKDVRNKSSESLVSSIIDALLTPETVVLSILRPSDIQKVLPVEDFSNITKDDAKDSTEEPRYYSASPMTPITCIKNLYAFNTRSIGQKLAVELVKSAEGGFGISFATRDTMVSPTTDEPIFIDRIMPTGSAVEDGRLQFGDRLLAINNVEVTSFESALSQLRNVPVGKKATLLVSRQNEVCFKGTASGFTADDLVRPVCRTYTFKIPVPPPEAANNSIGIRFAFSEQPLMLHSPTEAELPLCEPGAMIGEVFPIDSQEDNAAPVETQDFSGLYVQLIKPNSPADNGDASVRVGDRLIAVNGQNVMGRSLSEVAALLTSAITTCRARAHKHRPTIKFTVNRFFQRKSQSERLASERNRDVRPGATQSEQTKGHSSPSVPETSKTPRKKATVKIDEAGDERPSRSDSRRTVDGQERQNRSASVDPCGRSRKQTADDSPRSPKRSSSTFTREAMGRRSVSEKRHANMDATSFKFFNENVLPFRVTDEHTSRLYSTMPSVRGVRQLRRAKQGRSSGPVKPVHRKDPLSTPPRAPSRSLASSPDILRTDARHPAGSDLLFDVSADQSSESNFAYSRSHNQSFRNALDTSNIHDKPGAPLPLEASTCAPGPPVLPSRFRSLLPSAGDSSSTTSSCLSTSVPLQNSVDYVATLPRKSGKQSTSPPPVPARRTKIPTATTQSSSTDIPPDYQMSLDRHQLSRGLGRVNYTKRDLTSSAIQHQKIIQDFMKHHRSGKRDKYSLVSEQAASSSVTTTTASPSSHLVTLKKVTSIPVRSTSPPSNFPSSKPNPQSFFPKPILQSNNSTTRIPTSPVPLPIQSFNAYISPTSEASPELHNEMKGAPDTVPSSSQHHSTSSVCQVPTSPPLPPKTEASDFFSSVAYPKSPTVFSSRQPKSAYLEEVETCLRRKHTSPNGSLTVTCQQESPLSSSSNTTSSSSQAKLRSQGRVEYRQQPTDPYLEKSSDSYRRRPLNSHLTHPTKECWLPPENFPKPASFPHDLKVFAAQDTGERLPMPPPNSLSKIPRRPSSARYIHSPHTVLRSKSPAVDRFVDSQNCPTSRGFFDDVGSRTMRSPRPPILSSIPQSSFSRQLSPPKSRFEADCLGHCSRQLPAPPRYARDYIFKEYF